MRLYQLKDLNAIQMSSSEDMFETPKDTLGDTLLATDELTVYPGQVMVSRFERNRRPTSCRRHDLPQPGRPAWRTIQDWPMPGDPCKEQDNEKAGPKLSDLRIRMFWTTTGSNRS